MNKDNFSLDSVIFEFRIGLVSFVLLSFLFSNFIIFAEDSQVPESIPLDIQEPAEFTYMIHNMRDPFLPYVTPDGYIVSFEPQTEIADIHLEGIIFDAQGKSFAVINGNVFAEREFIGSFKLKEIKKDKIILQNGEKSHIIELTKEEESE